MLRDLLVFLNPDEDVAGPYALSLAKQFDAHATAVAVTFEPSLAYFTTSSQYDVVGHAREAAERSATRCLNELERTALKNGVRISATKSLATMEAASEQAARLARCHDLAIVQQNRGTSGWQSILAAALFSSGRPVLIVPDVHNGPASLSKVLVAWDGSARAARAVADALPLLGRTSTVEVVTVAGANAESAELDAASLVRHLARHAISAGTSKLSGDDVHETLLSYVADVSADLLVMGGYGHSRLRETLFGGTTRGILDSMTTPVFMAH